MKIACLSGKGGAGKTFVAVNLAAAAGDCTYIDCDVEEPNGRLFLKPEQLQTTTVTTLLPAFDPQRCTGCKQCVQACRFHALMYIKEKPMVFSEVCHSCGLCGLVCPEQAVSETQKPVGILEQGKHNAIRVVSGILNEGEVSGVPVIRQALQQAEGTTILDCPPGSACNVMETVLAADYCVLVVEPTAFGFHNFQMVYELVSLLHKPCGVVINKQTQPYEPLERFCAEHQLTVLDTIPYDAKLAEQLAQNEIAAERFLQYRERFAAILKTIGGCL